MSALSRRELRVSEAEFVEYGAVDRNHGEIEGAVAPHHESAQTMAHDGSAGGVSARPSLDDANVKNGTLLDVLKESVKSSYLLRNKSAHHHYIYVAALDRYRAKELVDRHESAREYIEHAERMDRLALNLADCMDIPLPPFESLYEFVRNEYLHSRFEGMNDSFARSKYEGRYSDRVVHSYMDRLSSWGEASISHYESRKGKVVLFNRALRIINPDDPHTEIKRKAAGDWS